MPGSSRLLRLGLAATFVVVGCRSGSSGRGPNAGAPVLPAELAAPIRAAIRAADPESARDWQPIEAHRSHGLTFERYTFDGGPAVVLVLGASRDVVTHQVWFGSGTNDERDARGSTAAIVEAMRPPADPLGTSAAGVTWHAAYWQTTTTPDRLTAIVETSADRIRDRKTAGAVAYERWDKTRKRWDNARLAQAFEAVATQRIGGPRLTRAGMASRVERRFGPEHATIVIAGAVERADALAAIAAAYPKIDGEHAVDEPSRGELAKAPLSLGTPGTVRRAYVWWPLEEASVEDHVAIEGVAQVLAARASKRLTPMGGRGIEVRHRPGRQGALAVQLELDETLTATVAARQLRDALGRIAKGDTTGLEVEAVQRKLSARRLAGASGLASRASMAALAWLETGGLDALARSFAVAPTIRERDLRRVADKHFSGRRPVIVVGRPQQKVDP